MADILINVGDSGSGGGGSGVQSVTDTNSIDLTLAGTDLSADLKLSAVAAPAGSFKATNSIQTDGLRTVIPEASGSQTGVLTSTDWTTFNNKEPAITAGTTGQYWRGDKTFQNLNIAALTALTAAPAVGAINEVLTAEQTTNTTTGIGLTGVFGNVTSISLPAGRYAIFGVAGLNENGAVLTDFVQVAISDSTNGTGLTEFDTAQLPYLTVGSDPILTTPTRYIRPTVTTTYYLNTKFNYTSGTPRHRGRITAIRIG